MKSIDDYKELEMALHDCLDTYLLVWDKFMI